MSRLLTRDEGRRVYIGILYALWQVVTEVEGADNPVARKIHNIIVYRDRERIPGTARYIQDRFASACQSLQVWEEEDRELLRHLIFENWHDWNVNENVEHLHKVEDLPEPVVAFEGRD